MYLKKTRVQLLKSRVWGNAPTTTPKNVVCKKLRIHNKTAVPHVILCTPFLLPRNRRYQRSSFQTAAIGDVVRS